MLRYIATGAGDLADHFETLGQAASKVASSPRADGRIAAQARTETLFEVVEFLRRTTIEAVAEAPRKYGLDPAIIRQYALPWRLSGTNETTALLGAGGNIAVICANGVGVKDMLVFLMDLVNDIGGES